MFANYTIQRLELGKREDKTIPCFWSRSNTFDDKLCRSRAIEAWGKCEFYSSKKYTRVPVRVQLHKNETVKSQSFLDRVREELNIRTDRSCGCGSPEFIVTITSVWKE